MNNAHGLKCVLSHPNSIVVLARSLHTTDIPSKIMVLEILGAVCLVPLGHKKVLDALDDLKVFAGERLRFQVCCWLLLLLLLVFGFWFFVLEQLINGLLTRFLRLYGRRL